MAKRYMQSSPQGEFLEPTKDLRGTLCYCGKPRRQRVFVGYQKI